METGIKTYCEDCGEERPVEKSIMKYCAKHLQQVVKKIYSPDKKIEEYLERARTLIQTKLVGIGWKTPEHALLVAQMIQLEEQHQELVKLTRGTALVN